MSDTAWSTLRGQLIVSCQAFEGDPLRDVAMMAALARAAALGGAAGIRANGPEDIAAIAAAVALPIIGLQKRVYDGVQCITPTVADAGMLSGAGAHIVAVEATEQRKEVSRRHPEIDAFPMMVRRIHEEMGRPVLADVSTLSEGSRAVEAGADLVATTLAGYTPASPALDGPDLALVRALARELPVPIIAEGHVWTPEQARATLDAGAFAVVVGSAITRPQLVTQRFVKAMHESAPKG